MIVTGNTLLYAGKLKAVKIGKHYRILHYAFEEFLVGEED